METINNMLTSFSNLFASRRKAGMEISIIMKIILVFAVILVVIGFIILVVGKGEDALSNIGLDILKDNS